MKRIVVITSNYLPNPDANGICAYNVIDEFRKNGDCVTCICNRQNEEAEAEMMKGVNVVRLEKPEHMVLQEKVREKRTFWTGLCRLWSLWKRRIKIAFNIKKYPETEFAREKQILSLLNQQGKVDLVIGMFQPYDGIGAAILYKKKHPDVIICGYFLDSLMGNIPSGINPKWYKKILLKNEKKIMEQLDIILKPESDLEFYRNNQIEDKVNFVNFPVCVKAKGESKYDFGNKRINLVFIGTLSSQYRSPEYLLKILGEVFCKNSSIHFHFFGVFDKMERLKQWEEQYKEFFTYHGKVSYLESRSILEQADFLINITNKDMKMIPSKVFEIMAQCKPIINVSSNKIEYYEKVFSEYPLVCNVNSEKDSLENNVLKLTQFIDEKMGKTVDFKVVSLAYYTSTPKCIYDVIEQGYKRSRNS